MALLTGLLSVSEAFGQIILTETFEGYSKTQLLCEQSDLWRTWSGESGGREDAPLVFAYPNTNTALKVKGSSHGPSGGPTDIVLPLGDLKEGLYAVSFDIYIPDAAGAYYNFQHFTTPGIEWAFSFTVEAGGIIDGSTIATIEVGGERTEFDIERGKWVRLEHLIDLDNDAIWLMVDSRYAQQWKFSSQTTDRSGTLQLGGINFYPLDYWNEFYLDNFTVERFSNDPRLSTPINGDFEESPAGLHIQPFGWRPVSSEDMHSQSSSSRDSLVDILSTVPPFPGSERYGTARSGEKFVAGVCLQDAEGNVTHTGISQHLRGLQAGELYTLGFYQSVIKNSDNLDPSGSWKVILNDSLIGVSEVVRTSIANRREDIKWTYQEMTFPATGCANQLKFLPADDDKDIRAEVGESLLMGLDRITLSPALTSVKDTPSATAVEWYPNPTFDRLYLNHGGTLSAGDLRVYDMQGRQILLPRISSLPEKLVVDVSSLAPGFYVFSLDTDGFTGGLFYKH